jgi:hypothetical protein
MSQDRSEVFVVVGDIGSAKELLPAVRVLESRGVNVRWIADPSDKAKAPTDVLDKAGIVYERGIPSVFSFAKVILVGTSATAVSAQLLWTVYGIESNIPVLWYEDLWGTGSRPSTQLVSPNHMLVIDDAAAAIARTVRPSLDVTVVGKPTFGALPSQEQAAEICMNLRSKYNLTDADFLVTVGFGGDPPERAFEQLKAMFASRVFEDPDYFHNDIVVGN